MTDQEIAKLTIDNPWSVNGSTMVHGRRYIRVDVICEEIQGVTFLNNPVALVPNEEVARCLVQLQEESLRERKLQDPC